VGIASVVANKVNLYKTRSLIIPIRKGAYRDLVLKQSARFCIASSFDLMALPLLCKQAVYRCGTDLQELLPNFLRNPDFSKSLKPS
jgi:hypothetical protein